MKNKIALIVVLCVALVLCVIAFNEYSKATKFLQVAQHATATVTAVTSRQATCKGSGKNSHSYSCTKYDTKAKFVSSNGQLVEVELVNGETSPRYQQGQTVKVLYDPANPSVVKTESTNSVWGGTVASSLFAVIFLMIGGGGLFFIIRREKEIAWLKQFGERIKADFLSVDEQVHRSNSKSGRTRKRYTYRITCQWLNPMTREVHIFKSESLKYHPGEFTRGRDLDVYIDRDNPKRYYVDLSTFPQLA